MNQVEIYVPGWCIKIIRCEDRLKWSRTASHSKEMTLRAGGDGRYIHFVCISCGTGENAIAGQRNVQASKILAERLSCNIPHPVNRFESCEGCTRLSAFLLRCPNLGQCQAQSDSGDFQ